MLQTKEKSYLGMEYLTGGRLSDMIKTVYKSDKRKFSDLEASTIVKSILQGVAYIHDQDIMHRDLKPQNIVFGIKDDLSSLKIVDFGLSLKYCIGDGVDQHCGTKVYMAPEIILKQHEYSKSVDIWAVGVIMYEVLTGGKHPFYKSGDTMEDLVAKVRSLRKVEPHSSFS